MDHTAAQSSTSTHRVDAEWTLEQENALLADIARDIPLDEALVRLTQFIEAQADDVIASVLLLDDSGQRLLHGAAPSLDDSYNDLVDGIEVGEGVGSCGTAAFRGTPVFVDDINTDTLWDAFRDIVRPYGLKACWSVPIKDKNNVVLGTFAIYRTEPGPATEDHLRLFDIACHFASLIITQHRDEKNLRESETYFRTIFEQAAIGFAEVDDVTGEIRRVNQRCCTIFDLSQSGLVGHNWAALLGHESISVTSNNEVQSHASHEYQIRRQDQTAAWIEVTSSPMPKGIESSQSTLFVIQEITERKIAEHSLRASEERFRRLIQHAPEAVLMLDVEAGHFIMINEAAEKLFKYSLDEMRQLHPRDVSPKYQPNGRLSETAIKAYVQRACQGETPLFDWTHVDRDGKEIPCEIRLLALQVDGKTVVRGSVIDVSQRRELEADRRLLDHAFESSQCGIVIVDAMAEDHPIIYCNPAFVALTGYDSSEIIGRNCRFLQGDDRDQQERHALRNALKEQRETIVTLRNYRKDGEMFWCEIHVAPIRDPSGKVTHFLGFQNDVTSRRMTEQKLIESESRLRTIFDQEPECVKLVGRDGTLLDMNPAGLRMVEAAHCEQVVGQSVLLLLDESYRESFMALVEKTFQGESGELEFEIIGLQGKRRRMHTHASPLRDADGGIVAHLAVTRDITQRYKAAQALKKKKDQLRELNASLERRVEERTEELAETNAELNNFAHTVSHDLRAPLRAMEGFAQALHEDYGEQLDANAVDYIRDIIASTRRMDELVNDLLAYSRLGRTEISLRPIQLGSVIQKAIEQLQADIEATHARIEIDPQLPSVIGHSATLTQVIANLLSNAIKFVAADTVPSVHIWAEEADATNETVPANGKSQGLRMTRIWIEDNGIGVSADQHLLIFRVFERLHGVESFPGTGIGLAVVARACGRLGGRYGVESTPGKGSRFWIEFPSATQSEQLKGELA